MHVLFHPKNKGKTIKIGNKNEIIDLVVNSKAKVRLQSEKNGPVVRDWDLEDIEEAENLIVSFDDGETYKDIAITKSKEKKP